MVTVTDQATVVLRATLAQARTQPGQTLRLVLRPGEALDEATIDTENTNGRRKIVISR